MGIDERSSDLQEDSEKNVKIWKLIFVDKTVEVAMESNCFEMKELRKKHGRDFSNYGVYDLYELGIIKLTDHLE